MKYFKNLISKDINLIIKNNDEVIDDIKKGFLDIGFVTKKSDEVKLAKWKEDELVVFSNKPLPRVLELEDLKKYKIICREEHSSTREFIRSRFEKFNFNCDDLNVVSIVHNSTALKYTILNSNEQFVSIISKVVIEEELKSKKLYFAKLSGVSLKRDIFIAYKEDLLEIKALINFLKD
jgi:DNA-binding transcriptional LysR family regulator